MAAPMPRLPGTVAAAGFDRVAAVHDILYPIGGRSARRALPSRVACAMERIRMC